MNASVLAHHAPFRIGAVEVRPATKTLVRDGLETVVEPRVMQVLVALAEAKGTVVSRDDLVERCWDGRIVGDDAVNRIMSRLRHLAKEVGRGSFTVETVTKVGYRLRRLDGTEDEPASALAVPRRHLLRIGVAAGAVAVAGGAGVWLWPRGPSADTRALMDQANLALRQGTREGQSQAVGLYQRVVADDPAYADGWATLGHCYAFIAHYRNSETARIFQQRARDAARRALSIDRDNVLARAAIASARPIMGNWRLIEAELAPALAQHGRNEQLLFAMSHLLGSVGRTREALALEERLAEVAPPTPVYIYRRSWLLWSAGRLEEADALLAEAARLYPTHFAIWFSRFYIAMFTGRADAALALASDRDSLPTNIAEEEIARGDPRGARHGVAQSGHDRRGPRRAGRPRAHGGRGSGECDPVRRRAWPPGHELPHHGRLLLRRGLRSRRSPLHPRTGYLHPAQRPADGSAVQPRLRRPAPRCALRDAHDPARADRLLARGRQATRLSCLRLSGASRLSPIRDRRHACLANPHTNSGLPTSKQILDFIAQSGAPAGKREIARAFNLSGMTRSCSRRCSRTWPTRG